MEFFSAGLNLNQSKILDYEQRPFQSTDAMNSVLIDNINKTVAVDDKLYIIGNFIFGSQEEDKFVRTAVYFRKKIVCNNLFLLYGNREARMKKVTAFTSLFRYCAPDMEMESDSGLSLILSFWPRWMWNRKDSYHLYGLNTPEYKEKCRNVSVDAAFQRLKEYRPFSLKELIG